MKKRHILLGLLLLGVLQACGQKGPIEVERPQVIQEDTPAETR